MRAVDLVGPVVVHDGGSIRYANAEFAELISSGDPANLVDDSLQQFVPPEYWEPLLEQFEQVESGEPSLGLQLDIEQADGTRRSAIAVSSVVDWNGSEQIHTSFLDFEATDDDPAVSLRKNAMHRAPVGITIADATAQDLPLIYANDCFVEMTGYPRTEVIGRNCRFLQGANTREEPVAEMRAAVEEDRSVTVELRNYRRDGSMFWNRVTISPVRDESGAVTHYLGFQEDISDEKVYERERALFEKHAESSDQVMYVTNSEGRIEYVNPAFEEVTGYDADEALGRTPELFRAQPTENTGVASLSLEPGESHKDELDNRAKSGKRYRVHRTVVPIIDDREMVTHYTVIERNVTDEQLTTQVLNVLDRVLRHNVRTAVNVIDGYAEFLESSTDSEKQQTATKAIRERSTDLREISEKITVIRGLLEDHAESSPLRVAHLEAVIDRLRKDHPEAGIDLRIEVDKSRSITKGAIFQSALSAAVENAVNRTDGTDPDITITVTPCEDNTITVEITDTGATIPDDEWAVIEAGTETPLEHMSGIGLWLVYWSVVALGGTVERERSGAGENTLVLRIPLAVDSEGSEPDTD
jgi:PAS domain S-box-containing protein